MNPLEFKAWFDGFSDGVSQPSPEQWAKVKEKVGQLKVGGGRTYPGGRLGLPEFYVRETRPVTNDGKPAAAGNPVDPYSWFGSYF